MKTKLSAFLLLSICSIGTSASALSYSCSGNVLIDPRDPSTAHEFVSEGACSGGECQIHAWEQTYNDLDFASVYPYKVTLQVGDRGQVQAFVKVEVPVTPGPTGPVREWQLYGETERFALSSAEVTADLFSTGDNPQGTRLAAGSITCKSIE